jgi:drug/metabolite transporter (DMT)-like permease
MNDHAGMSAYERGVGLTSLGAFLLTFDTLLLRLIHGDLWTVVFCRGVFMFLAIGTGWVLLRRWIAPSASFFNGAPGLVVAGLYGMSSIFFVLAVSYTNVANVLFIIATAPLWAALLSVLVLKENVPKATWAACLTALCGILLVAKDALLRGSWLGDAFALATAASMGSAFVATRRAAKSMFTAPALGGLLSALVAAPLVKGFTFTTAQWCYMGLEGALVMPLSLGLIAIGPKYLPAPQVGLFLLLETVLGPVWVWLVFDEVPSTYSALGGCIIVATLVLHSIYFLVRSRRATAAAASPRQSVRQ